MHFPDSSAWVRSVCIALIALVFASPAIAEPGQLRERLTPESQGYRVQKFIYKGLSTPRS